MRGLAAATLIVGVSVGCSSTEDVILKTAAGVEVTAAQIDAAPVGLLPAQALGLVRVDSQTAFQSHLGKAVIELANARMPVPPAAGFDPVRDLKYLVVGFYALAGADFVGIASGTFDRARIESAADGVTATPLGAPLVKSQYSGRTLFTSANIGFVVLTSHTALFGDETGIRRALDRMERGIFQDDTPQATRDVFATPGATFAATFNVAGDPTVASAARSFPFLGGLEAARLTGDVNAPGLNVRGTLHYSNEAHTLAAARSLTQLSALAATAGFLTSIFGMSQPLQRLDAVPKGRSMDVALSADGQIASKLMHQLASGLGAVGATR